MKKGKNTKTSRTRGSSLVPVAILALGVAVMIGLMVWRIAANEAAAKLPPDPNSMEKQDDQCTHTKVNVAFDGLETESCTSAAHAAEGTPLTYPSDPPTSGTHWPSWVTPGFYKAGQPKEKLVHSLEHGHVVIYYDQKKLSAEQLDALQKLAGKYKGQWDGVVAIPRTNPDHAVILTAWERRLPLANWDQAVVDRFVDAFRGRGPENPVR
jgi:hypothetical protein